MAMGCTYIIVPAIASPSVPPRFRTKLDSLVKDIVMTVVNTYLRNDVTTAISRLSTPAWTAMRDLEDRLVNSPESISEQR